MHFGVSTLGDPLGNGDSPEGDGAGGVSDEGGDAESDEGGKGEEGAAAGDGVGRSADEGDEGNGEVLGWGDHLTYSSRDDPASHVAMTCAPDAACNVALRTAASHPFGDVTR